MLAVIASAMRMPLAFGAADIRLAFAQGPGTALAPPNRAQAENALNAGIEGKLTSQDLMVRMEDTAPLASGVRWRWMELRRLHMQASKFVSATAAASAAEAAAHDARDCATASIPIGDGRMAHGEIAGAMQACGRSQVIARQRTASDPPFPNSQRGRDVSNVKISEAAGDQALSQRAFEIVRTIEASSILARSDSGIIDDLKRRTGVP